MKIPKPDIYFGKKLKVTGLDGSTVVGYLYGYSYDYDEDDNYVMDFDVEREDGLLIGYTETEIASIEILSE